MSKLTLIERLEAIYAKAMLVNDFDAAEAVALEIKRQEEIKAAEG